MALDPALFDAEARSLGLVRWPADGELIMYRRGSHFAPDDGRGAWAGPVPVVRVWCGIEVMIDLEGVKAICPALRDRFALREVDRETEDMHGVLWREGAWRAADGDREPVMAFTEAVCRPESCADGHRCGRLDLGLVGPAEFTEGPTGGG